MLESTTYPGTTREVLLPLLEASRPQGRRGLPPRLLARARRSRAARTGRRRTCRRSSAGSRRRAPSAPPSSTAAAVDTVHRVSSPEAAELTKLLENIFRSVNIALVNELAQLCDRMEIDVWEVVDAAATKPFGFMSFKPGPGLGGHCIPIDPFYLTWKAREYDFYTEFIELAGKVNENMPYYCRSLISQALNHGRQRSLSGSKILVLGVAYKPDIGDMRECPALKLIELLQNAGAEVSYHDPHVAGAARVRPHARCRSSRSKLRLRRDRDRPLGDRLRGARRRRHRRSSTSATRPARRAARATRSGSCDAVRVGLVGPRLLGPEPRAQLRRARRAARGSATVDAEHRERRSRARYPRRPRDGRLRRAARRPRARRGRDRDPVPTHYALAKQALEAGQARASSRSRRR